MSCCIQSLYSNLRFFFFTTGQKAVQKCFIKHDSKNWKKSEKMQLYTLFSCCLAGGWCRRFLESYDIMACGQKKMPSQMLFFKSKRKLAPLALWAARRHEAPLRYLCPEFESRLKDLFPIPPLSLPLHFLVSITIMQQKKPKINLKKQEKEEAISEWLDQKTLSYIPILL